MKLSDLFEAKLSKWEVSVETGPHQFVTITVNAADKADAEKKAMAEAKRRRLNSPMLGQAKLVKEAGQSSPFRKNEKVVLSDKGLLGTVESVSKAWEYFTVKFVDGRHANVNFNQAHKLKKFTGQMVTAKQNAEISELLQYGNDPEEVAKIMRIPLDTVLQLKPEKSFTEEHVAEGKMRKESASDIFYRYEKLKKSFVNPTPEQKKMLDNVLAMATAAMDEQFKKTQSNLEAKFAGSDWWEEVKKMYKVKEEGNKWVVISNARDWKQTKDWEFDTKYEALEQLEKLVKYKAADRKAGKGDVEKDFERVDALRKREQA